jgi:hypothetical protein
MRKMLCALTLALGLATVARADTSVDQKKDPTKEASGKVKTGGACKVDADCDQANRAQRCRDSKCALVPVHPVT